MATSSSSSSTRKRFSVEFKEKPFGLAVCNDMRESFVCMCPEGSQAHCLGIRPGMKLVKVGDMDVSALGPELVLKALKDARLPLVLEFTNNKKDVVDAKAASSFESEELCEGWVEIREKAKAELAAEAKNSNSAAVEGKGGNSKTEDANDENDDENDDDDADTYLSLALHPIVLKRLNTMLEQQQLASMEKIMEELKIKHDVQSLKVGGIETIIDFVKLPNDKLEDLALKLGMQAADAMRLKKRVLEKFSIESEKLYEEGLELLHGLNHKIIKCDEGIRYIVAAATAGCNAAVGHCLRGGLGSISQNKELGYKFIHKAGKKSNAYAFNYMGEMYENGDGVEKNTKTALKWYRKSADGECALGQYNLGRCVRMGVGIDVEKFPDNKCKELADKCAAYWIGKSAEKGFCEARFAMAELRTSGRGVEKDLTAAEKLYREASKQGHEKAMEKVMQLEAGPSKAES
mmetsp:Transcript_46546/g.77389  ORF Transcript_46546/g.77389 Transcript_46546/m.77389 type:complete len:461 (-) Transcript_46546:149-1531(-)|eukprot:jgi/Bigna1/89317/estExt_fgenesh1_pg.C_470031